MMITPNRQAKVSSRILPNGPFSNTLPLELATGPKLSDATQKNEKANQSRK
jgi:hypothetical protein